VNEHKYHKYKGIGPGGIKCSCCIPVCKKATKKLINRRIRRKMKQEGEE
jgi:hypothetical protein